MARFDELHAAWDEFAQDKASEGMGLFYQKSEPPQRLLQNPLKPLSSDLDSRREWFSAGRSMRDTEPASLLELRRPDGSQFGGER